MGTGRHYQSGFCLTHSPGHGDRHVPVSQSSERRKGPRSAGQRRGNESGESTGAGVAGRSTWSQGRAGPISPDPERLAGSMGVVWMPPATDQMGWGLGHSQVSIKRDPEAQGTGYWNEKVGIWPHQKRRPLIRAQLETKLLSAGTALRVAT